MAHTVLIVEDNPLNLELARDILEANGYTVLTAVSAAACTDVLAEHWPDLILMDVQLPGKDGLTLVRELRAEPQTRDLLIVALSAHAMTGDSERALAAGCDAYLPKPIQTRLLAQQVAAFIAGRPTNARYPSGDLRHAP
jgi:CheY-like chemotaxis protein